MSWWLRVDPRRPWNPKWVSLSDSAYRLGDKVLCWGAENEADTVPDDVMRRLAGEGRKAKRLIKELVECGIVLGKAGILEPVEGGYKIHDAEQYWPPDHAERRARRYDISEEKREKLREAGRRGADAKWRDTQSRPGQTPPEEAITPCANGHPKAITPCANGHPKAITHGDKGHPKAITQRDKGHAGEISLSPPPHPPHTISERQRDVLFDNEIQGVGDLPDRSSRTREPDSAPPPPPPSKSRFTQKNSNGAQFRVPRPAGARPERVEGLLPAKVFIFNWRPHEQFFEYAVELGLTRQDAEDCLVDMREKIDGKERGEAWIESFFCRFVENKARKAALSAPAKVRAVPTAGELLAALEKPEGTP